jgi:hypothetical protein
MRKSALKKRAKNNPPQPHSDLLNQREREAGNGCQIRLPDTKVVEIIAPLNAISARLLYLSRVIQSAQVRP